jgi:dipeptidyl aminopeptidase/acylaminoacyl peptidase
MTKRIFLFAAAASLPLAAVPLLAQTDAPLIERQRLFGNPSKAAARISPDGKWLSWIAPRDGVLNIWVAPADDMARARAVTAEKVRPIRQYFWAPDSSRILFLNDRGGDENFLLYGVDVGTGVQKILTPFEKTRVQVVGVSPKIRDRILVGLNNRDPRWWDVHSLDLATGRLTPVLQNDSYDGFVADADLNVRVAQRTRKDGQVDYFRVSGGKIESAPFATVSLDDAAATATMGFTTDGRTLYWRDSRGRDTAALVAQDVATGRTRVLAQHPKADVAGLLTDPMSGKAIAWNANHLRSDWTGLDPKVEADLSFLEKRLGGDINVVSQTLANDVWVVGVDPVTKPTSMWRFDRKGRKLTQLFVTRPELEGATLAAMKPLELKSRDGMNLVSYLTLPPGSDPDGDGRPSKPVPMVLFVHGGPWARDNYGFNSTHQWLANRGYGVLSVNYRGSTGFGKNFVNASRLQWGRAMHDDLIDAVDWAVKSGITTSDKVAIMGGSYGGYATLAGLTLTPDKFACGVDIVGPSNLVTLYESFPPYWQSVRVNFATRMGDPTTPEGRAMLLERSPITHVDKIRKPLLIGQGANDPRVVKNESDQIVAAMRAKNIPVTYVLFPDEGHGFARPQNSIAFNAVAENFLSRCLGGRAEPIGDTLKASTAQVPHGAEFAPGLKEALALK